MQIVHVELVNFGTQDQTALHGPDYLSISTCMQDVSGICTGALKREKSKSEM